MAMSCRASFSSEESDGDDEAPTLGIGRPTPLIARISSSPLIARRSSTCSLNSLASAATGDDGDGDWDEGDEDVRDALNGGDLSDMDDLSGEHVREFFEFVFDQGAGGSPDSAVSIHSADMDSHSLNLTLSCEDDDSSMGEPTCAETTSPPWFVIFEPSPH